MNKYDSERIYREILLFEHFQDHPNIIKLLNVIQGENDRDIYLILEYMEANLFNVIRANILSESHIKFITYQLLIALKYIHSADIMNRDLKPSHLLLNADGCLKLSDFALAKSMTLSDEASYKITDYNATRWYRAPEILLSANYYDKSIDLWSVGCILGEMISGKTVFPGNCTINQLDLIMQLTGRPSPDDIGNY
jgi:mitogen-activated protein kinase 15